MKMITFKDRIETYLPDLVTIPMGEKLAKMNDILSTKIVQVKGHKKDNNPDSLIILDDLVYAP